MKRNSNFRELDLVGWEQVCEDFREWLAANTPILNEDYLANGWVDIDQTILDTVTSIKPLFAQIRLVPVHVAIYVSKGVGSHEIHTHPTREHARLNLPIMNCEGTYTVFYETASRPMVVRNKQGVGLMAYKPEDCTELERFVTRKPTVLHIRTPHQVLTPDAPVYPRITATFQFQKDPVFLLRSNDELG